MPSRPFVELNSEQLRVLGCLIEKEATTPDNYPLSSNSLAAAASQSTNRDPLMSMTEREADQVMIELRELGLARTVRGDGQRVHKHRHVLDEAWQLPPAALALVSIMMLRGPQTLNELRTRTERHGTGLDAAGIESLLNNLGADERPFVVLKPRRSGEREARWMHLLGGEELAAADSLPVDDAGPPRAKTARVDPNEITVLQTQIDELTRRFDALLDLLGETIE